MKNKSQRFYDIISFFYPIIDIFFKPQKKKLFNEINSLPFGKVLEIGVGNGMHLHLYKNHQITGIDTSNKMLSVAKNQNIDSIKLLQMNGEQLLFPNEHFDYIILSHVITVVQNPEQLVQEIHRVLKPKGKLFILNHFTPNNWLKYIDKCFNIFSKYFHFKSHFYINDINSICKFALEKEIHFSKLSYFKLLIFKKP